MPTSHNAYCSFMAPSHSPDILCSCWYVLVSQEERRTLLISAEARTVAFIDIGTNSIRLLVVRIHPDYSSTVLTQLKQMIRLGDGAFTLQHLQPDAIDRAVYVARQFAQLAR